VDYGSEFRVGATLSNIFQRHPKWTRMSPILTHGSEWPLEPIDEERRLADVRKALIFGNHKGALMKLDLLLQLMLKDVHFSYCLPLPLTKFGVISETICDLVNAILLSGDWDPSELFAPNQHLVPESELLEPDIPFAAGAELIVEIPVDPRGILPASRATIRVKILPATQLGALPALQVATQVEILQQRWQRSAAKPAKTSVAQWQLRSDSASEGGSKSSTSEGGSASKFGSPSQVAAAQRPQQHSQQRQWHRQ
jgi:hypothetical protein